MESGVKKSARPNPLSFYSYMANGSESDELDEEKKPDNDDENPFSFKAFDPTVKKSNKMSKEKKRSTRGEDPLFSGVDGVRSNSPLPPSPISLGLTETEDPMGAQVHDVSECLNCRRLNKENKRLNAKLQESSESIAVLQKRVNKLSAQLKARDERESAEASQLEEMLHQVEKNLHQSTKRAEKSERTVDRLNQEISQLKAQLEGSDSSRRAREVGVELVERSAAAKQMLKELLRGVERVAVVGESLQGNAMFSEL